jgi:hypothetical protein
MDADLARMNQVAAARWRRCPLTRDEAALAYPLLLAVDGTPEPLAAWRSRVALWLRRHDAERTRRGIMTLRTASGVIAALFFHAVPSGSGSPAVMTIRLLRAVEPAGRWHGLAATLRAAEDLALGQRCGGILVRAEEASSGWREICAGLDRVGRPAGYVRCGPDWFRPIPDPAGSAAAPAAR